MLGAGSCWPELEDVREVNLATHVSDWRDEVIYQLLVDRFADGDTSNDLRVDRTALGRYQGGDWQGVEDHLDYLQRLGVTTLWISPIVRNVDTDAGFDAYHGYWAQDLTLLNPHFGDLASLRRLVRACHARNLKVVVDIVTNHMGQMFFYDINNNGQPDEYVSGGGTLDNDIRRINPGTSPSTLYRVTEYDPDFNARGRIQGFTSLGPAGDAPIIFFNHPDIFRIVPRSDILPSQAILASPQGYHRRGRTVTYDEVNNQPGEQTLNGDFPGGLKDVATEDPRVRDAMFEAYWRWVRLTDIDGFRIDTIKHVEHGFWQNFASRIRTAAAAAGKRNFLMFGEAFDGNDRLIASYANPNEMDSVVYFSQKYRVFDNIFQCGSGNTRDAENLLRDRLTGGYWNTTPQPLGIGQPPNRMLVNFIDNHDVSRFLYGMNPTIAPNIDNGRCDQPLVDTRNPADVARFRPRLFAALTYLLTEDGIPAIYYGTEQDFTGGNDPANRERLWDSNFDVTEVRNGQPTTFAWTRRLLGIRRDYSAFRRGTMAFRYTTDHVGAEPDAGIMAYERVDGANYGLVVIHAKSGEGATTDGTNPMTVSAAPVTDAAAAEVEPRDERLV